MSSRQILILISFLVTGCAENASVNVDSDIPTTDIKSGYEFLLPETQSLQNDAFENPGYLWVERGQTEFNTPNALGLSCANCHEPDGADLRDAAAQHPKFDSESDTLLNLEGRINACQVRHMNSAALQYESDTLLGLTAFIANLSKGQAVSVAVDADTQEHYLMGQEYFYTRRGQFNLSCAQCHNENWGKRLRGDTISQGHGNGFPAYRLEWQSLGSLQRRLRDCDAGVRAEPLPYGSETYLAVELYLAARGTGLEMESPAIRR